MANKTHCGFVDERGLRCTRYAGHAAEHNYRRPTMMEYLKNQIESLNAIVMDINRTVEERFEAQRLLREPMKQLEKEKNRLVELRKLREARKKDKKPPDDFSGGSSKLVDFGSQLKTTGRR